MGDSLALSPSRYSVTICLFMWLDYNWSIKFYWIIFFYLSVAFVLCCAWICVRIRPEWLLRKSLMVVYLMKDLTSYTSRKYERNGHKRFGVAKCLMREMTMRVQAVGRLQYAWAIAVPVCHIERSNEWETIAFVVVDTHDTRILKYLMQFGTDMGTMTMRWIRCRIRSKIAMISVCVDTSAAACSLLWDIRLLK